MNFDCLSISLILLTSLARGVRSRESLLNDLFQKGKTLFTRSFELRKYDDVDGPDLYPEHKEELNGIELDDYSVPKKEPQGYEQHHPSHHKEHHPKHNGGYKLIYHTDIVENDNMDLYGLIGGLSFASFLATTLFVLSRRNGSLMRSLDEVYRSDTSDMYFKRSDKWSKDELLAKLGLA